MVMIDRWDTIDIEDFLDKVMEEKVTIRTENTMYVLNPKHVVLAYHEYLPSGGKSQIVIQTRNGTMTIKLDEEGKIVGVYLK